MRADDWFVDFLIDKGVTDVFGIPGVVIMDFLYAVDRKRPRITPHLNYHEQGASFAACGYAQVTGKLGVAYSTRGPGVTNMLTAMADAYYDSIPVMFVTAHSAKELDTEMRVMNNQEIDTVALAKNITKRAVRIDSIENFQKEIITAYHMAIIGRKGPVFVDIWNGVFSQEVDNTSEDNYENGPDEEDSYNNTNDFVDMLSEKMSQSHRPVLLIGNGAREAECKVRIRAVAERIGIPVLASRAGQDIIPDSPYYFGFVGSRATRYSNFILSKADLIIAIGNRLSFPTNSKSFLPLVENACIIRIDTDEAEFNRNVPNSFCYQMDSLKALSLIEKKDLHYEGSDSWLGICRYLKDKLDKYDSNLVIRNIMNIIGSNPADVGIVCDVGNHSFWVTTAHAYQKANNRIMYSGSFGTLGSALPKAIGVYYATRKPVLCFTGDQGVQFNIQELQFISRFKIPVNIIVLNNSSSGMIMEREIAKYGKHLVHTTVDSDYSFPDFEKVAECYDIDYKRVKVRDDFDFTCDSEPHIIEMIIAQDTPLEPSLPIGKACQDLSPELPRELYDELNRL